MPSTAPIIAKPVGVNSFKRHSGEQRIAAAFAAAHRNGRRAALIPFLMGGFPTLPASREIAEACIDNGADILELGIPSADPLLDGPVIRAAAGVAIRGAVTAEDVLDVARVLSARVPVVIMCYADVVLARGAQRFAEQLRDAGVSGLIVADMRLDRCPDLLWACDSAGIALVGLLAPTMPDDLAVRIGARSRGFVYALSSTGKTGERVALSGDIASLIRRARAHSAAPVALGFGISTPEHVAQAADAGADAVIVGSRLVREAAEARDPVAAVGELVGRLAGALAVAEHATVFDISRRRWEAPDGQDLAAAA